MKPMFAIFALVLGIAPAAAADLAPGGEAPARQMLDGADTTRDLPVIEPGTQGTDIGSTVGPDSSVGHENEAFTDDEPFGTSDPLEDGIDGETSFGD